MTPLQLLVTCEFSPGEMSELSPPGSFPCIHCGQQAGAAIHSPARRAAVAIRYRWPPIGAGLEIGGLELVCDFCRSAPATCVGCGTDAGEILAACDEDCGHGGGLDDGGPCVPARGATVLDWEALQAGAAEALERALEAA